MDRSRQRVMRDVVAAQRQRFDVASWPRRMPCSAISIALARCCGSVRASASARRFAVVAGSAKHFPTCSSTPSSGAERFAQRWPQQQVSVRSKSKKALRDSSSLRRCGFFESAHFEFDYGKPLERSIACGRLCFCLLPSTKGASCAVWCAGRRRRRCHWTITTTFPNSGDGAPLSGRSWCGFKQGRERVLYGPPGTGKTEFARALAVAVKRELHEVPNEDKEGDPITGQQRFSAYTLCQNILAQHRGQLVLFDEVEGCVRRRAEPAWAVRSQLGATGRRLAQELGERDAGIQSGTDDLGVQQHRGDGSGVSAPLRLVVEVRAPGRAARRRMVDRYFRAGEISPACAGRIADIEALPPAQITRAARVLRAQARLGAAARQGSAARAGRSLRAMGVKEALRAAPLPITTIRHSSTRTARTSMRLPWGWCVPVPRGCACTARRAPGRPRSPIILAACWIARCW